MGLFGLGLPEIAVIGGVAALIFGAPTILINIPSAHPPLLLRGDCQKGGGLPTDPVVCHPVTYTLHGWS